MSFATDANVSVLLSTKKYYDENGLGQWVTLGNYNNKADFLSSVKELCKSMMTDDDELIVVDVNADFNVEGLISKIDISELVWDYIALADDYDIQLVQAYISCYEIDETIAQTLVTANKALFGVFTNDIDMAIDFRHDLAYKSNADRFGVFASMDTSKLSNQEMADELMNNMSKCNSYYFWDKEDLTPNKDVA